MPCSICPDPSLRNSIYCRTCGNLVLHQREGRARVVSLKRSRRPGGFRCEYCGVLVDLSDPSSPRYISFDHRTPGVLNDLAVSCAVDNVSKANLTWQEYPLVVHEAVAHWDTGRPFRKDVVPFAAWNATSVVKATNARLVDSAMPARVLDAGVRLTFSGSTLCWICDKYPVLGAGKYCARCNRLVCRTTGESRLVQATALKNAFCARIDGFQCHHFGVPLDLYDWTSPFYLWFDHPVPRMKGKLVASSALANRMKADMDVEEFRTRFRMLDAVMQGGTVDWDELELKYWKRNKVN